MFNGNIPKRSIIFNFSLLQSVTSDRYQEKARILEFDQDYFHFHAEKSRNYQKPLEFKGYI